jgi:hypothetical protein
MTNTADNQTPFGILIDSNTNAAIRPATRQEFVASMEQMNKETNHNGFIRRENPHGIIWTHVDGVPTSVFVIDCGPENMNILNQTPR